MPNLKLFSWNGIKLVQSTWSDKQQTESDLVQFCEKQLLLQAFDITSKSDRLTAFQQNCLVEYMQELAITIKLIPELGKLLKIQVY